MGTKPIKGKSGALNWLRSKVFYDGEDCLIWPFSSTRGYGQVYLDDKLQKAARVMCEWVNGCPPTPKHEAAHSCGKGHLGCVHPKHLSWKTRAENHKDAIDQGTAYFNGKVSQRRAKLTRDAALKIRAMKGVKSQDKLAAEYGVSHSTIAKIHRGELWRE